MRVLVSVLLIAIGVFYTATSFSNVTTEIMDIDFDLDTDVGVRYDSQPGISKERMQQRIRMGFTLDYRGTIQLIGLVSTGNDFDSDWQTIYDLNSDDTRLNSPKPFFRQLYAQMQFIIFSQNAPVLVRALGKSRLRNANLKFHLAWLAYPYTG